MALAQAADGRIAGHLAQGFDAVGEQQGAGAAARAEAAAASQPAWPPPMTMTSQDFSGAFYPTPARARRAEAAGFTCKRFGEGMTG